MLVPREMVYQHELETTQPQQSLLSPGERQWFNDANLIVSLIAKLFGH